VLATAIDQPIVALHCVFSIGDERRLFNAKSRTFKRSTKNAKTREDRGEEKSKLIKKAQSKAARHSGRCE
jgi:hypothetical protein